MKIIRFVFCLVCIGIGGALFGQTRSPYFDQAAQVVPPLNYDSSQRYPAIVFLPYTTGTSEAQARSFGIPPGAQEEFVVILPAGRFTRDDYLPNFMQFVEWYEERLLQDLAAAFSQVSIDPGRVYLAGYSLGGDLGWALSVRNPDRFAGAVMSGTRASYPITEASRRTLRSTGYRGAFLIGDQEDINRSTGIERAHGQLDSEGIETMFRTYRGGHRLPPRELLLDSVSFVTRESAPAAWATAAKSDTTSGSWLSGSGASGSAAGSVGDVARTALLRTPSSHFGLMYEPGFEITGSGFQISPYQAVQLRAESLFDDIYLRGLTGLESRRTSEGDRLHALTQEVAIAYGRDHLWGAGFSWDWYRWFAEGDALRQYTVSAFWIHQRSMVNIPASVLEARFSFPRAFNPFVVRHVFNAELRYHLHVTDYIKVHAGLGSNTEQNRPYSEASEISTGLDHVLFFQVGAGFRFPGPFRWSVLHHGRLVSPVDSNTSESSASWRFGIEYLF